MGFTRWFAHNLVFASKEKNYRDYNSGQKHFLSGCTKDFLYLLDNIAVWIVRRQNNAIYHLRYSFHGGMLRML